jgi:D-alanine--poly(phosphoribitol) ligase subunit 1
VPSLLVYLQTMKLIDRASFPAARVVMFGGEGYPKPMLRKLFDAIGGRVALVNVYGPTECTCIASAYRVAAGDFADMQGLAPLGEVDANFSRVVVDAEGRPAADGATGELCLGGPCVGLGYYNDPAQTARAFVQNPTHDRYLDRVYRTGDLVRVGEDGKLRFMGRADSQIKHQGYRIELGEIEHALGAVDAVDEAAAVHLTGGGPSRIIAVVASGRPLAGAEVRASAARLLPAYMLPERIIVVGALPKNANGKIDRPAIRAAIEQGELA